MIVNKPELSIIIVAFNAKTVLAECLKSIRIQTGISLQTIVVDNNSNDGTVELLKKDFPEVVVHQRKSSKGFAAGNNAGVSYAKADHILFLNPDTKFIQPTDLARCLKHYQTERDIGVLTCRIELALTGKLDETCHRGFPTPWAALTHFSKVSRLFPKSRIFGQYLQSYKDLTTEHEVDSVGGMFMLVSKKIGDLIGWWDEDFPLYGEDLDFCFRVKEKGFRNIYWPEVTVLHYKGFSTGMSKHSQKVSSASINTTRQVRDWSVQAMEIFYAKHYRQKYSFLINWLVYSGIYLLKLQRTRLL